MTRAFAARRVDARARLDGEPDVVVPDGKVGFRHAFETVEDSETFCFAPEDVVDAGRRLLTIDAADGISAAVHDTVVMRVGATAFRSLRRSTADAAGASSRSSVHPDCSAFLDVRVLQHVDVVKCVLMGSRTHDFSTFPPRLPHNMFRGETGAAIRRMVLLNHSSAEIRMTNNVLATRASTLTELLNGRIQALAACSCGDDLETSQVGKGQSLAKLIVLCSC